MANKSQNNQSSQQPTAQGVMNLMKLNCIVNVRVINFCSMHEIEKERICDIFKEVLVTKTQEYGTDNMLFFLSTRTHRMAEMFNCIANGPLNDLCDFDLSLVCVPNHYNRLSNIWYSLYNKKGGRK